MLNPKERFNWQTDTLQAQFNLLLERVNFFLVGTAFIITAFATVVTSEKTKLNLLGHFLCGTGYYLALFFTATNYLNSKVIELWSCRLEKIEVSHQFMFGMRSMMNQIFAEIGGLGLFKLFIRDFAWVFIDPFGRHLHPPGRHTWMLPLAFAIFWGLVWTWILPAYWTWTTKAFRLLMWPQTICVLFVPALGIMFLWCLRSISAHGDRSAGKKA